RAAMFGAKDLFRNSQGALVEGLGLFVLALVTVEVCQVVERFRCMGVLRAKHLFSDSQGTLVEALGLLVLALVLVVDRQVVEQVGSVGMIAPVACFPNGERVVEEWFCFWIVSTISQVTPGIIQQCCCFSKGDAPLFDEFVTDKGVRKIALTARPRC